MATFALIHSSGDVGWYWYLVERELRRRGHDAVAPDLPCEDDAVGLGEYADTVVDSIGTPWPLEAWPDVPARFVLCTEDRFFPPDWMRRVVEERPRGDRRGHCVALSRPGELADLLVASAGLGPADR